jgi:hypothetical protein
MIARIAGRGMTPSVFMLNGMHVRVAIRVDMLMRRRQVALVAAQQTRERRAESQDSKKADDNAVPLHDPEQGA